MHGLNQLLAKNAGVFFLFFNQIKRLHVQDYTKEDMWRSRTLLQSISRSQFVAQQYVAYFHLTLMVAGCSKFLSKNFLNKAHQDELKILQTQVDFITYVRFSVRSVLLARGPCHKCKELFFLCNLPRGHRSMEKTEEILGCFHH